MTAVYFSAWLGRAVLTRMERELPLIGPHNETLSVVAMCVSYLGIIASIVACIQMKKEEYNVENQVFLRTEGYWF